MKESAVMNSTGPRRRVEGAVATLATNFDLRHNSIAFLRVMLSALVVLGHSWELGGYGRDPLARQAGVPLGVFGVQAFFVLGGFLVAGSFEHSHSWRRYLANRALRIFPGYWACLLVTAAFLVPVASALSRHPTAAGGMEPAVAVQYVVANFLLRIHSQPSVTFSRIIPRPAPSMAHSGVFSRKCSVTRFWPWPVWLECCEQGAAGDSFRPR